MVEAVSVKLPTFWTTSPSSWFAQAQYYHVVSAFDSATTTHALSIITSPPETEKFKEIKIFLTSAFELSECERTTVIADSKPSELMDAMLALLGTHKHCFLFKQLFLQQLPDYV